VKTGKANTSGHWRHGLKAVRPASVGWWGGTSALPLAFWPAFRREYWPVEAAFDVSGAERKFCGKAEARPHIESWKVKWHWAFSLPMYFSIDSDCALGAIFGGRVPPLSFSDDYEG
jgi:hypothetical protein